MVHEMAIIKARMILNATLKFTDHRINTRLQLKIGQWIDVAIMKSIDIIKEMKSI